MVTAPAASAVRCTHSGDLPDRVVVDRPQVSVPVLLRGCAGRVDWADAFITGPAPIRDYLLWGSSRTAQWRIQDWNAPPGVYDTDDGEGWTTDGLRQPRIGDRTVVKYGAWAGVRDSTTYDRSTGRLTTHITAAAARYNATTDGRSPWSRVVRIERCMTAGCTFLSYVRTDATGVARISIPSPGPHRYWVFFGETATHWGAYSALSR